MGGCNRDSLGHAVYENAAAIFSCLKNVKKEESLCCEMFSGYRNMVCTLKRFHEIENWPQLMDELLTIFVFFHSFFVCLFSWGFVVNL